MDVEPFIILVEEIDLIVNSEKEEENDGRMVINLDVVFDERMVKNINEEILKIKDFHPVIKIDYMCEVDNIR